MASTNPHSLSAAKYEQYAKAYMRSLPLEHYAESTGQSGQRAITLKSLSVLRARLPEVQVFNELLLQYHHGRDSQLRQVVPDNMVLVWNEPIKANLSFDLPLQPVRPLWVLDYLSKYTKRKDYKDHFRKYERELKVPFYLRIDTDHHQFTLFHHTGQKYVPIKPNAKGRLELGELNLEIGLLDEAVRYWYQGDLLLLPGELLREIEKNRRLIEEAKQLADEAKQRTEEERRARLALEQESARLKSQIKRLRDKRDAE
ncbi:MAG: Uma2 family endonuclease [Gemmataceae bacterium]